MKHPRTRLWCWLGCGAAAGCVIVGCGAATPDPARADSAPAAGEQGSREALPAVVLTPMTAPQDLLAVARASSLPQALDTLAQWAALPFEWRSELARIAPGMFEVVDWEAPVEFAATLDPNAKNAPRVFFALSLPLRSREAALALAAERSWTTDVLDEATHTLDIGEPCYVSASLGSAAARLVCSPKSEALEALAPFMTRGLPTLELPKSTLFASVKAEPFRRRYAEKALVLKSLGVPFLLREVRLDNPTFDSALADAAHAIADEAIGLLRTDLDALTFELELDQPMERLQLGMHFVLQDKRTWLGDVLADLASRATEPTALFWSAPPGTSASYAVAGSPDKAGAWYATLARLVAGLLEHAAVATRGRELVAATERLSRVTGPTTLLTQADVSHEPHELLPFLYYLAHVQGDAQGAWVEWLDEATELLADPAFQKSLKERLNLPTMTLSVKRQVQALTGKKTTLVGLELGGIPSLNEGQPAALTLLMAHDAGQSWVGVGQSVAELTAGLTAWQQQPETRRAELAVLQQKSVSGGFSSVAALLEPLFRTLDAKGAGQSQAIRGAMPGGGSALVAFRGVVNAEGPRASLYAYVPKGAVTDLAQAALAAMAAQ